MAVRLPAFMQGNGSIEIASVGDRPPRTIFAHMLTDIIEPRAMELLSLIRDDLQRAGLDGQLPAGFVLAGGGARLHGLDELAAAVPSICPCASRNQKAWLICRKQVAPAGICNRSWTRVVRRKGGGAPRPCALEILYPN